MYRACREAPDIERSLRYGSAAVPAARELCRECCGELFSGDRAYTGTDARGRAGLICSECLDEIFSLLRTEEKAALIGSAAVDIGKEEQAAW